MEAHAITPDLIAQLREMLQPRPVLNADEAAKHVGMTERTFRRWRKRWQVRNCGRGRYSVRALNAAMEREART